MMIDDDTYMCKTHEWNKLNLFTFCTVQNDIIGHCPAYWINCVTLFYLIDMQGIVIVSNYDRVPSDSHSCSEDSICSWWQPSCSRWSATIDSIFAEWCGWFKCYSKWRDGEPQAEQQEEILIWIRWCGRPRHFSEAEEESLFRFWYLWCADFCWSCIGLKSLLNHIDENFRKKFVPDKLLLLGKTWFTIFIVSMTLNLLFLLGCLVC